jgi:transcriptional regulator with XRE-family HTH domain
MNEFFILIKKFSEEEKIAMSTFAMKCGLNQSYFRNMIKNESSPTLRVIKKICLYKALTLEQFGGMLDKIIRSEK